VSTILPQGGKGNNMTYTPPEIVDYGDLTDVTAGGQTGENLDAAFPDNTPRSDLTFS